MKLRIGGVVLVAAAALALAGCGGSSKDNASSTDATTAYRDCLAKNGVTLPSSFARPSGDARPSGTARPTDRPTTFPTARPSGDTGQGGPGGGFGGANASAFAKAEAACASLRPSGQPGFGNRGGNGDGANAAYRNCLSQHGVTLTQGQQLNTADPKVIAAEKTCAVLRPSPTASN